MNVGRGGGLGTDGGGGWGGKRVACANGERGGCEPTSVWACGQ